MLLAVDCCSTYGGAFAAGYGNRLPHYGMNTLLRCSSGTPLRCCCNIVAKKDSSVRRAISTSSSYCPFQILGLPSPSSSSLKCVVKYEDVRIAFRKLALQHHPDTAASQSQHADSTLSSSSSSSTNNDTFATIRKAFEDIVEGPNGEAVLRCHDYKKSRQYYNNDDMEINRTAVDSSSNDDDSLLHSSINPQILHEVAQVAEEMNPGGLDKGGMWQYANMIHKIAKEEGLPPLRVGVGEAEIDGAERQSGVASRRRRKRK